MPDRWAFSLPSMRSPWWMPIGLAVVAALGFVVAYGRMSAEGSAAGSRGGDGARPERTAGGSSAGAGGEWREELRRSADEGLLAAEAPTPRDLWGVALADKEDLDCTRELLGVAQDRAILDSLWVNDSLDDEEIELLASVDEGFRAHQDDAARRCAESRPSAASTARSTTPTGGEP